MVHGFEAPRQARSELVNELVLSSVAVILSIRFIIIFSTLKAPPFSILTELLPSSPRDRIPQNCGQRRCRRASTYAKIVSRLRQQDRALRQEFLSSEFGAAIVVPHTALPDSRRPNLTSTAHAERNTFRGTQITDQTNSKSRYRARDGYLLLKDAG